MNCCAIRDMNDATPELQTIAEHWETMFHYRLAYTLTVEEETLPVLKRCLAKRDDTEYKIWLNQRTKDEGTVPFVR